MHNLSLMQRLVFCCHVIAPDSVSVPLTAREGSLEIAVREPRSRLSSTTFLPVLESFCVHSLHSWKASPWGSPLISSQ